ncbi:MAG: efflux RND transporter permease subunit [Calditrichia bacterium]
MRLPKLAIENHQFTLIMMALLGLFGLTSFLNMPRSEDPQFTLPITGVVVVYPGADPTDLEKLVADPIEEAINEIEDIKKFDTTIEDGLVVMQVEFYVDTDPDEKEDEVNDKINSIRGTLPDGIVLIDVLQFSPSNVNIMQVALQSETASYRDLDKQAETLKKKLERIAGIKKVETWAFPESEVRISIDMEKMAAMNIPLQQVAGAIQSENANIPGGNIDIGGKKFNLETSGNYETIDDIGRTIVRATPGSIVYLRDIADISFETADETHYGRLNGKRAIFVTAIQKASTNIFTVMEGVNEQITQFENTLPETIALKINFNQSISVDNRLGGFFTNLMQGIILVGIVMILALGLRASAIVMLAIPLSILIAIGFVDLNGYGIQQMTIVGLVIALGLLVDNATVVTENVSRFMQMGHKNGEAAVLGTGQIGWPIVSSTITTVLAFVPMVALQSTTGSFIRSMPVTVIYTLLASLIVSLTLTPFLSSRWLKPAKSKKLFLQRFLNMVVEKYYRPSLKWGLQHPSRVLLITFAIFFGSLLLFPLVGVSLFPKADKAQFIVDIDMPEGTSLDKTNSVARFVESELAKIDEVEQYTANIGRSNPRVYYNMRIQNEKSTHAQILVGLAAEHERDRARIVDTLRARIAGFPGARIQVKEFEQGPPILAPVEIKVIGEELKMLGTMAEKVAEVIESSDGTLDVYNPLQTSKTNLHLDINREKASMLGVRLVEIDRTIRAAVAGLPVSTFKDKEGEEYNIVLRLPVVNKTTIDDLQQVYVSSVSGAQIPLKQLSTIEFKSSPPLINHFNLERMVSITSNVQRGYSTELVTADVVEKLDTIEWPDGFRYSIGGEVATRQDAFGGMIAAILVAMVGIMGVLVLQFRSYVQPIIVFSAIPVALTGSIFALFLTGYSFSFTAFVGLTSLVGIVVNNSIILVDYTNQLRDEGKELLSAITLAGETRLTPIVLTTATTVGGLLPLTLAGGTLWAPMGWTIIGGLLVSTFLTLLVVPVLYKLLAREVVQVKAEPV